MEISKIIKEARIKKGMTQQELADSVYVTRQTISKWELGKSIPDEVSFRLLCQCLEIDNNVRKKIAVNKQHLLLIMIAIMFSPVVLGIRYILYKIGKIEDQKFIIMIKSVGFVLFALYFGKIDSFQILLFSSLYHQGMDMKVLALCRIHIAH